MMNEEILIELKNIGVSYNIRGSLLRVKKRKEFWALKDISLTIKKGEVLGVIGRNGAGKSTLLSLLSGIISPNKGSIVRSTEKISLLSLQTGFIPYLSGRKNIILSGMFLGIPKKILLEKMDEIIEFSELGDFIDAPVDTYSSGMKARLGFSTAIHLEPDIILIDEVLGVGDKAFKEKSSRYMREKIKNSNTTALLVSHNQELVEEVCTRAVFIKDGKIEESGEVGRVFERYNEFLGQSVKA
jgi:lipopolysaccharide transport system ATP-binding protein